MTASRTARRARDHAAAVPGRHRAHETWQSRIAGEPAFLAGSETAVGAWVADIPLEDHALALRAAIASADETHPVEEL